MKKIILSTLLALNITALSAQETKMLPILDADYCPAPTVALMGGYGSYSGANSGTAMYGVEAAFACPVFQIKDIKIHQVLSLVHSSKDGLKTTTLEMNPQVIFDLSPKMHLGVGPGIGVIFAKGDKSDSLVGINFGASFNYDITPKVFVGIDARYQWAGDADLYNLGQNTNLDNMRTMIKVGRRF